MKTTINPSERSAKIIGAVINSLLILAGGFTVIYGITTWAQHYVTF